MRFCGTDCIYIIEDSREKYGAHTIKYKHLSLVFMLDLLYVSPVENIRRFQRMGFAKVLDIISIYP